jgi:hypothetical protein
MAGIVVAPPAGTPLLCPGSGSGQGQPTAPPAGITKRVGASCLTRSADARSRLPPPIWSRTVKNAGERLGETGYRQAATVGPTLPCRPRPRGGRWSLSGALPPARPSGKSAGDCHLLPTSRRTPLFPRCDPRHTREAHPGAHAAAAATRPGGGPGISTDSARGPETTGNNRHYSDNRDTDAARSLASGMARLPGTR